MTGEFFMSDGSTSIHLRGASITTGVTGTPCGSTHTRVKAGHHPSSKRPWSAVELQVLRELYPKATRAQIRGWLGARTTKSIDLHARTLGLKRPSRYIRITLTNGRRFEYAGTHLPIITVAAICERIIAARRTPTGRLRGCQDIAAASGVTRRTVARIHAAMKEQVAV